jgi:hypothetical protein
VEALLSRRLAEPALQHWRIVSGVFVVPRATRRLFRSSTRILQALLVLQGKGCVAFV